MVLEEMLFFFSLVGVAEPDNRLWSNLKHIWLVFLLFCKASAWYLLSFLSCFQYLDHCYYKIKTSKFRNNILCIHVIHDLCSIIKVLCEAWWLNLKSPVCWWKSVMAVIIKQSGYGYRGVSLIGAIFYNCHQSQFTRKVNVKMVTI